MNIIILLFVIIVILDWIYPTNQQNRYLIVVLSIMVIVRTFVDISSVPDLDKYFSGFLEIKDIPFLDVGTAWLYTLKCPEIGFRYLLKLCSYVFSFRFVLFIIAVLSIIPYYKLIKAYSPFIVVSIIIFYLETYLQSVFVLRQHLAIAITLLAYPAILRRDFRRYCFFCVLAFTMHQSAIIFFPVYFLYGIRNRKVLMGTLFVLGVVVPLLITTIFSYFIDSFVGYDSYQDNVANLTSLFISLSYFISYIFFVKNDILSDGINKLIFVLLATENIILLGAWSMGGVNRLLLYFSVVNLLSVPITMNYISNRLIRGLFCFTIVALLLYITLFGNSTESFHSFRLSI